MALVDTLFDVCMPDELAVAPPALPLVELLLAALPVAVSLGLVLLAELALLVAAPPTPTSALVDPLDSSPESEHAPATTTTQAAASRSKPRDTCLSIGAVYGHSSKASNSHSRLPIFR